LLLAVGVAYYALPLIKAEPAARQGRPANSGNPGRQTRFSLPRLGPTGVCGLHGRLVRDLPGQQAHHAEQCRGAAAFSQHQVQLLRADWTRQDPAITRALQSLGRSGVPVYVLYLPGKPPVVMSELLSKSEVLDALQQI
jgi:thiol:disulfide interchange protein DsbD